MEGCRSEFGSSAGGRISQTRLSVWPLSRWLASPPFFFGTSRGLTPSLRFRVYVTLYPLQLQAPVVLQAHVRSCVVGGHEFVQIALSV